MNRRLALVLPALALPVLLSACSNDSSRIVLRPPCPNPAILAEAGDLSRFRDAGRDLTDLTLSARIQAIGGSCRPTSERSRDQLDTRFSVAITAMRGPASPARTADIPWFVALMEGGEVIAKQSFTLRVNFPANQDQVSVTTPESTTILNLAPGKTGAAYQLMVGFQLSPEELAYNRSIAGK